MAATDTPLVKMDWPESWFRDGPWCENSQTDRCPNQEPKPYRFFGGVIWLCDAHRPDFLTPLDVAGYIDHLAMVLTEERKRLDIAMRNIHWWETWAAQHP